VNWLIAIAAYVLFALFMRLPWAIPKAFLSFMALAVAVVYLARTEAYQWFLGIAIMPFFGWVGGLVGASAAGIATLLVFLGTAVLVVGLFTKREVNREVYFATVTTALLVTVAIGPVAAAAQNAANGVTSIGASTIGRMLGA
jgi:hypothetical protein